jgi:hypothetical protein
MSLQTSFAILSAVVEQYESRGQTVQHVEATASDTNDAVLDVSMNVPVSLCAASGTEMQSSLTPETASLTDGGGLQVKFSTSALMDLPPAVRSAVSTSQEAVAVTDGDILLDVELTIEPTEAAVESLAAVDDNTGAQVTNAGAKVRGERRNESSNDETTNSSGTDEGSSSGTRPDDCESTFECDPLMAVRDESVPPYEDVAYLERLYETCATFTEMSEKIVMDVSSETVRRYMIEADVHDPTSYNTVSGNDDEETDDVEHRDGPTPDDPMDRIADEQLVADGIGLPKNIRLEDVADAVVDSLTVYEVQQHLNLERQRTQKLLKQLNLIDLVTRQIADNPEESVTYEQVAARIRQCEPAAP